MTDLDSLSEGELEDGEVLSSEEEEEGQGDAKVCKKEALCVIGHAAIFGGHVWAFAVSIFRTPLVEYAPVCTLLSMHPLLSMTMYLCILWYAPTVVYAPTSHAHNILRWWFYF